MNTFYLEMKMGDVIVTYQLNEKFPNMPRSSKAMAQYLRENVQAFFKYMIERWEAFQNPASPWQDFVQEKKLRKVHVYNLLPGDENAKAFTAWLRSRDFARMFLIINSPQEITVSQLKKSISSADFLLLTPSQVQLHQRKS